MSNLWLKATDKQIGVAFGRSVEKAKAFVADYNRTDPADRLVLAGAGVLLELMHHQLEYLIDRKKRDPDALLKAFAEEIQDLKTQLEDAHMPITETAIDETLFAIGIEQESEKTELHGSFGLNIRLRHMGLSAVYHGGGRIVVPPDEYRDAELEANCWTFDQEQVLRMGRELCGLAI